MKYILCLNYFNLKEQDIVSSFNFYDFCLACLISLCKPFFLEILKRLDDVSHDVRLAAAETLTSWFKCIGDGDGKSVLKSNIEFLYRELLIHLDDPDQNIQQAVLGKILDGL